MPKDMKKMPMADNPKEELAEQKKMPMIMNKKKMAGLQDALGMKGK